jgi:hypothetical protein
MDFAGHESLRRHGATVTRTFGCSCRSSTHSSCALGSMIITRPNPALPDVRAQAHQREWFDVSEDDLATIRTQARG